MKKQLIQTISDQVKVYRDPRTGIAWVEDTSSGCGYSAHANIAATGSVAGMKARGWWGKADRIVRCHGFIYNIDTTVTADPYDEIARQACQCAGRH